MKSVLIFAMASFHAAGIAAAATTITATNVDIIGASTIQASAMQVIDQTGQPLVNGTVEVGTFSDPINLSLSTFLSFGSAQFTQLESYPGIFGAFNGPSITGDLANSDEPDDAFTGRRIYVVIVDPNGSGEFIAWDSNQTFAKEVLFGIGAPITVFATSETAATLVRGRLVPGGNTGLAGPLTGANGGTAISFLNVPEPSSSHTTLLLALALLFKRTR